MQQILGAWAGLDPRKRIMVVVTALLVVATLYGMSRLAARPNMALLYAGLDATSAGDVVRALDQQGVAYQVRGDSIYVPMRDRDALRMTLAGDGLPATGGRGYELLDGLSGFGTTSQMFDAAYWRAKEGELARTIVGSPHIAQARVHIANGSSNPFQRSVTPTASIAVVPSGGPISAEQAQALRFLVASAVAGLDIADVAVIDSNGKVIGAAEETVATSAAQDRAEDLREKVLRLVEARVGRGNAVVEVTVDTVTETESIRERRFDPDGRVAISTDTEERSNTSTETNGAVTVASNLPDGDAAGGGSGQAETSETRERINYEVSEVEREVLRSPGAVRRLTIAVLVNNLIVPDEAGAPQSVPREEAELDALRELVASAVGFDAERGDVITLKTMELPALEPEGTTAQGGSLLDLTGVDIMQLAQVGILALVALVLGLFVVRPILAGSAPALASDTMPALPPADGGSDYGSALDGEIDGDSDSFLPPLMGGGMGGMGGMDDGIGGLPSLGGGDDSPADRLRNLIGERQDETIEILRNWLEDEENA
ncbi:flagellar basal-body MS-ring/collar protein FliF [Marinibacterium profundimaris]|uniref:Flagellar M-ring protein n=1 Tax=Marinibacterium profundimaris TaxID=1679460 RepID=A0A225NN25_9RHOB|nr:flagellar basal-body MS-ring/collar protein FliF [Marinibacterium profundimaris]OWU75845.1 flagellar M-ring protein FliF [Marinibacterium profundimaris]